MSKLQSVYFLTTYGWTPDLAYRWLLKHSINPIKSEHLKGQSIRFRIVEPSSFKRFRTKVLKDGVRLVIGFRR